MKGIYTPRSNIPVDEAVATFKGRSKHAGKIPNKPKDEGFMVWVLAEVGVVYNFPLALIR